MGFFWQHFRSFSLAYWYFSTIGLQLHVVRPGTRPCSRCGDTSPENAVVSFSIMQDFYSCGYARQRTPIRKTEDQRFCAFATFWLTLADLPGPRRSHASLDVYTLVSSLQIHILFPSGCPSLLVHVSTKRALQFGRAAFGSCDCQLFWHCRTHISRKFATSAHGEPRAKTINL